MSSHLTTIVQTLTDGIAVGSLYALIALGYTLVFGILQFINFAHGDVFALGAWVSWLVASHLVPGHPVLAVAAVPVGAVAACAVVGLCIERFAYKPLRNAPKLNVLITAIGVSLLMENVGQLPWAFGTQPQMVPAVFTDGRLFTVAKVDIGRVDVGVFTAAVVIMAGVEFLIFRTRLGSAMRAVSYNQRAAALMGIDVDRTIAVTFVIGSALAGAAGFLYTMKYPDIQHPAAPTWILLGLKAFVAAVVGGIGNVRGAMLGGLLIGVFEFFGNQYSSQYRDVFVFLLLIVVLLVRPSGLLGKSTVEKV